MYPFVQPALAQTRDYSKSNNRCTHLLSNDTPVHTWNKRSLDVEHDMRQAGMGVREREGWGVGGGGWRGEIKVKEETGWVGGWGGQGMDVAMKDVKRGYIREVQENVGLVLITDVNNSSYRPG